MDLINRRDWFKIVGVLFFLGLAGMALSDAKSRILITDPAYYLFNIINRESFFEAHGRLTAIFSQLLVVGGVKIQLPLVCLVPLYSVSFVLIRVCYFFVATSVFKNRTAGFTIIAVTALGVAHSYFRPTSESSIALLNSCLLYAWLNFYDCRWQKAKMRSWRLVLGTFVFVLFGYFTHSIAYFSLLFVIGFFSVESHKLKTSYPYLAFALTLAVFFWHILNVDSSVEHQSLYHNAFNNPLKLIGDLADYYPVRFFIKRMNDLYFPLLVMLLISLSLLVVRRRYLLCFLLVFAFAVYFVVTSAAFKQGDADMQMEKIFLPLVFFVALSFGSLLNIGETRLSMYLLSGSTMLIAIVFFFEVGMVRSVYQGRIQYQVELIEHVKQNKERKWVITPDKIDTERMMFSWANGVESLLLSAMMNSDQAVTIFVENKSERLDQEMGKTDSFLAAPFYLSYGQSQLNRFYFNLPNQAYVFWPE
ncbi:hypothetical protein [Mangrovibacterium marinum]|uniref:Dolichyl-phosphate-mannose-protein mannosyltransferase n=1 Tax=Mangrovibacterium marinum TaxID=1639118 RepID=A0A2T5C5Y5_9BACT|nr:hypothetical protein [Mangrovibacterium marinum]PTN10292.1 hypothetical protein C8N47_102277 [Mangrovibacterium marinum]